MSGRAAAQRTQPLPQTSPAKENQLLLRPLKGRSRFHKHPQHKKINFFCNARNMFKTGNDFHAS
jgi:hypothetical protein